jgi:hypothetical protein
MYSAVTAIAQDNLQSMKATSTHGMTAQWQHMQQQFHIPFLPYESA